jgi:hypothetical protein
MNAIQKRIILSSFWKNRANFYRDIATAIDERELLRDFIDGEYQIAITPVTADKEKAEALGFIRKIMEGGVSAVEDVLSQCMPPSDKMGISVIADAKDKAAALRYVAANVEQQGQMNKVVSKALASPAILLPVAFAFAYVMAGYVIPAFEKSAPPSVWVGFSAIVRDAAFAFRNFGPFIFAGLFGLISWFVSYGLSNITSRWRYKAESTFGYAQIPWLLLGPIQPMLSIYRDIESSRMLANLATLLQSGRGLQDALGHLAQNASPWMRKHLLVVIESLQLNPGDYVLAFSHGILSRAILARLHTKVRRDAGNDFSQVLIEIGTSGQEKAREAVGAYAVRANAILLLVVFSIILFFYGGQNWIIMQIQEETSPSRIQKRALEHRKEKAEEISLNNFPTQSTS